MRAVVLIVCLLSAVVVGAAYHYRNSWYGGSWLASWVERGPAALRGTGERDASGDDTTALDVSPPSAAPTQDRPADDPPPAPAGSMPQRVAAALAESGVAPAVTAASAPPLDEDSEGQPPPSADRSRLTTEVAKAVKATSGLAPTGAGGEPTSVAVMEGVADVVGEAVGTALADTVSEDEAPALAETVARAVAEAIAATPSEATEQEVADAVAHAVERVVAEKQAERYIARITEPDTGPVAVERADHFVTQDQVISLLPEASLEATTLGALTQDPELDLDAPITVVHDVEQIEMTTPEKLIAAASGELDRPVRLLVGEEIEEITIGQVIERYSGDTERPIAMVQIARHYEITTPGELAEDASITLEQPLTIVRRPYRLESATVAELLRRKTEVDPDTVFYIRTVTDADVQGIWGIVYNSLVENYALGMRLRHGDQVQTYRIDIPPDADELLADRSSSYLGRLIDAKTSQSYVYNFMENRMGRNPDRIVPGQEIVIIDFQPEELIDIYKHFLEVEG